ncbi:MAG: hypothetical protein C4549_04895 [Deltaproteobacteria bacterium]|jgi:pyrroline-5-carboxylate reductase|nr:MAG: hypothetical protein C4549_04895 [Deltaproteobacteria bacterium]
MLDDKKIGFIGSGNMAEAIIKGVIRARVVSPKGIVSSGGNSGDKGILGTPYLIVDMVNNQS